jgi:dihydroneopterin aldolase
MDCRRLFLRDYEVWINIGVHDFEKKGEQRVLINVDLYVPLALSTPRRTRLDEVVDYDFIRRVATSTSPSGWPRGHIHLQETLADEGRLRANKLAKRLRREVGQAIADFNMIEAGDKVMVCLSGGKDSFALLDILLFLREHAPVAFDIVAVNLDQKQPGFPADVLPDYLRSIGVPFHIEKQDTYSIVKRVIPEGQDHLLAVLAPAPRRAVPRRRRTGRDQDRARPPPRRHPADAADQHVLRRQAEGHAAQAGQRRRPPRGDPPAGLRGRSDLAALGRAPRVPHHPLHAVRQPGPTCSACRSSR